MPLEVATYISSLVSTNPVGASDGLNTADDHLRLIKAVLKASFPNINGAVTATPTVLNYSVGVTSSIQTQLNAKLASASYTAADVLTKIKTVDGAGSGLDADLLDGISSAGFLLAGGTAVLATALATVSGSAPSYAARAFGQFTNDTTASQAGVNATITYVSTGLYTVTFSVNMPVTTYAVVFGTQQVSGNPSITAMIAQSTTPTAAHFQLEVTNTSGRINGGGIISFAVFT